MKYNCIPNQIMFRENDGPKVIIFYNDFMGPYED
jgi:hypothetical protein